MIEVENHIQIYEANKKELPIGIHQTMSIKSHWNDNKMVIISIPMDVVKVFTEDAVAKGKNAIDVTVGAEDLEHAVVNATNTK